MDRLQIAVESLIVDGENDDGDMAGDGTHPPFALFSPDLQCNVGGPYAERLDAEAALIAIKEGDMVPYTDNPTVVWTVKGKPSPWYDK